MRHRKDSPGMIAVRREKLIGPETVGQNKRGTNGVAGGGVVVVWIALISGRGFDDRKRKFAPEQELI